MNTNRQTFWNNTPALAASLSCVGCIHGNHLDPGTFSLVFKHLPEQTKPCIVRRQGKMPISVHKSRRKVFNRYQVVPGYEPITDLVQKICPLISNMLMQASNLVVGFSLVVAPFDLSRGVTLQPPQFRETLSQPMRVFNQLASREGSKVFQTNINTDLLVCLYLMYTSIRQFEHQANIPPLTNPLEDNVFYLSIGRNGPVITHPHFTNVLNVKRLAPFLVLSQFTAIVICVFQAIEATGSFITRKPRLFPYLQAAKESSERFVQAAKQVLKARSVQLSKRVRVIVAHISKMRPLCSVTYALARFFVGVNALLQCGIVNKPGLPKHKVQALYLFRIRAKEVFVGTIHILVRHVICRTSVLLYLRSVKLLNERRVGFLCS